MAQRRLIRFTQRLDDREFERLQSAAESLGWSKSAVARTALQSYLDLLDSPDQKSRTPVA